MRWLHAGLSAILVSLGVLLVTGALAGGEALPLLALLLGVLAFAAAWRYFPHDTEPVPSPQWQRWRVPLLCGCLVGTVSELTWLCLSFGDAEGGDGGAPLIGWRVLEQWMLPGQGWQLVAAPIACFVVPALVAMEVSILVQRRSRRHGQYWADRRPPPG